MKLIGIRHLPTSYNKCGLLQGSIDNPIVTVDELQKFFIKRNREILEKYAIDRIVVSGLMRTRQTALAYGYNDFFVESMINEINFGKFEGKPKQLLLKHYAWEWENDVTRIPFGESMLDFKSRLEAFIQTYREVDTVLMFGHGFFMRALRHFILFGDISKMNAFHIDNNCIFSIDTDD